MSRPLSVFFLSSEVAPFAKTGGLADVSGSLPKALRTLGIDVRVALPYYRMVKDGSFDTEIVSDNVEVPLGKELLRDEIHVTHMENGVPVYLTNKDEFFDRQALYGTHRGDYFDNLERFVFFCKAAFRLCEMTDFAPDIIHCNDWQTGLVPPYLRFLYRGTRLFSRTASVFTIHNLAYQGLFGGDKLNVTGLPDSLFTPEGIEFWGRMNLLKSGVVFSECINTVSQKYSREIQTPEFGCGLDGVLRSRKEDLFGIVNGADYKEWNPRTDPFIAANYDAKRLDGKVTCKEGLLGEFGLPDRLKALPVIGVISRLVSQKGFDLLADIIDELIQRPLGLVMLGTGESKYERLFLQIAARHPEKAGVKIAYDNTLAHKIEAGSDMFLMPSQYEPCGLNQIYSLKYGTVPVVRATGGLADTIVDFNPKSSRGTGFKFSAYRASALLRCIDRALSVYQDRQTWKNLMRQGMQADFSWERSAKEYVKLYEGALARIRPDPAKLNPRRPRASEQSAG